MIASCKDVFRLLTTVNRFEPDLILLEGPGFLSSITLMIKSLSGLPLIVRIKGDIWQTYSEISHDLPFYEKMVKYLNFKAGSMVLRHADAILPISDHLGDITKENLGYGKRMFTVHIPFAETPHNDSAGSGIIQNTPSPGEGFVLTVTNFNFWAKVEPLLDAVKRAAPVIEELGMKWIILGDGFFLDKFKQSVCESAGSESVVFTGRRNPTPYYKNAKALLYISGMDGLPNVLLEAWYFRLPVIINKECDSVEFVVDGYNGVVADFGDPAATRDILGEIIRNDELRNTLGGNSYLYLQEHFSVRRVSSQLENAIKNSLSGNGVHEVAEW